MGKKRIKQQEATGSAMAKIPKTNDDKGRIPKEDLEFYTIKPLSDYEMIQSEISGEIIYLPDLNNRRTLTGDLKLDVRNARLSLVYLLDENEKPVNDKNVIFNFPEVELYEAMYQKPYPLGRNYFLNSPRTSVEGVSRDHSRNSGNLTPNTKNNENEDHCSISSSTRRSSVISMASSDSEEETLEQPPEKPKIEQLRKPNPITLVKIDDPINFFENLDKLGPFDYEVRIRGELTRIYPNNTEAKQKIIETLKANKVPHYFSADRDPVSKCVIRGLYQTFPKEEIAKALENEGFEFISVNNMTSRRTKKTLPLFVVQYKKTKNWRDITKIRSIGKIRIEIEFYRPDRKAMQCFRCQHFNHVAANCNMLVRCVVCGDAHDSNTCPVKQEKNKALVKCCNCGGNHASSYKGCPSFPVKSQYKKTYASVVQKSKMNKLDHAPKNSQRPVQNKKPLVTQELYQVQEFANSVPTLIEIIAELNKQLGTDSLESFVKKMQSVLDIVTEQKDSLNKAVAFADAMKNFFSPNTENASTP